ncbi:hypothetical protein GCM10025876_14400 [Demequina litorisediminis]|uniref:Gfo/Idh/MocA-like oxidoreductase N-terminal domain-containing protein n=1 Tax=Demequina litorisediminis TaxID=1849022 RepID=A0ABQ6IDA6_9MICO|nr:Gfo/Idh/MocA family oxidoreductase [Demequina litorisediminis]GMA35236.1 hypothetical protein GCM10025876_14400 [Demequina litorisediminis]
MNEATQSEVVAVAAASSQERAQAFADEKGIAKAYGSYEELVADPDVDIVYVATTHNNHHEPAILAINAGKHVLVEKAFTQNEAQAQQIVDAARAKGCSSWRRCGRVTCLTCTPCAPPSLAARLAASSRSRPITVSRLPTWSVWRAPTSRVVPCSISASTPSPSRTTFSASPPPSPRSATSPRRVWTVRCRWSSSTREHRRA